MKRSFSMTTAAALGDGEADGASDAADVGAAELVAAALEADGDDPGEHAARNAAAADIPPAYRKPRRLNGVWAILRTI
jgi:hypothetical protein